MRRRPVLGSRLRRRLRTMFSAGGIGLKLEWPSAKWARCPVKGGVAAAYKREISAGADPKQRERELEAELREWCAERISKVTQPRSYAFVEELPRIPSGKLAKHELRKLYGNPVAVV